MRPPSLQAEQAGIIKNVISALLALSAQMDTPYLEKREETLKNAIKILLDKTTDRDLIKKFGVVVLMDARLNVCDSKGNMVSYSERMAEAARRIIGDRAAGQPQPGVG